MGSDLEMVQTPEHCYISVARGYIEKKLIYVLSEKDGGRNLAERAEHCLIQLRRQRLRRSGGSRGAEAS